ncbi:MULTISPECIES: DISARM system phospholipase D-like protein DrmC [Enterobacterales]|uniref:DISARM system phospholipase D-like protein DrmC n=1 Tax=Enterobacterales TaxID=91347 RepID=UPI0004349BD7|nr:MULTISPECIES: DISARM system phospholipase D-like protein DrmC [Enterobacterales]PQL07996.1 phospholipase [Pantoea ananatis]UBH70749.1 DISARM system phospholipase D-like protein DrmC [Klebsiella quasipneumoniae]UDC43850.1 DISARM system phospholipase D-like protein DrmC [Klebsiella quasipneumoniae subsp. similipneumoniae]CDN09515.1 Phospholipase D/Transphosphatidylase [Klebsiella quasipneumoniae subsp. similipneumoniae]
MHKLLDTITTLICLISLEKVEAIAARIRQTEACKATASLSGVVGTPAANIVIKQLIIDWENTKISSDELASMLLAASYIYTKVTAEQSTELVWTGPTTPFVSARRTEQALLQIISNAKQSLFITSFVAYDVSCIVNALNVAIKRGVVITMLLESSSEYGGSINFDHISKMKTLMPHARIYLWENKPSEFSDGRVHAKVIVADSNTCFITSANLTGYAMEKNIEVGVLITNGSIPALLHEHLNYLISTKVITPV